MIRVFIGFDQIEAIAYHVCVQSIVKHTRHPVSVTPLKLSMLQHFTRPRAKAQSNEFTYSRFLTPSLSDFKGISIYMDCDMMLRASLADLLSSCDLTKPVNWVQHDYTPKLSIKYLGNKQEAYPRKNWSSLMVFNNALCRKLTPGYVARATPAELHRMEWASDIGSLPLEWNHLVGEYEPNPEAKLVHWSNGGPWFSGFEDVEFHAEWYDLLQDTTFVLDKAF